MATNNAVNTSLSGQSGTGAFAGTTSPTFVTPTLGAATATSLTFSPTTGGIVGTTTNNNTTAGDVGEFVSSVIASASSVSLSTGTSANVTSISLTAGDWDVWGNVNFTLSDSNPAASTLVSGWMSTTSATLPDSSLYALIGVNGALLLNAQGMCVPGQRYSLSGTSTIFLSAQADFTTGASTVCGGIYARRRR